MESIYDYTSIFMAGLAVGLIGSHWFNKWERKLQYEIGYNAGVNSVTYGLIKLWATELFSGDNKHKTNGGGDGNQKPADQKAL